MKKFKLYVTIFLLLCTLACTVFAIAACNTATGSQKETSATNETTAADETSGTTAEC